jgi:hypothetical protein
MLTPFDSSVVSNSTAVAVALPMLWSALAVNTP